MADTNESLPTIFNKDYGIVIKGIGINDSPDWKNPDDKFLCVEEEGEFEICTPKPTRLFLLIVDGGEKGVDGNDGYQSNSYNFMRGGNGGCGGAIRIVQTVINGSLKIKANHIGEPVNGQSGYVSDRTSIEIDGVLYETDGVHSSGGVGVTNDAKYGDNNPAYSYTKTCNELNFDLSNFYFGGAGQGGRSYKWNISCPSDGTPQYGGGKHTGSGNFDDDGRGYGCGGAGGNTHWYKNDFGKYRYMCSGEAGGSGTQGCVAVFWNMSRLFKPPYQNPNEKLIYNGNPQSPQIGNTFYLTTISEWVDYNREFIEIVSGNSTVSAVDAGTYTIEFKFKYPDDGYKWVLNSGNFTEDNQTVSWTINRYPIDDPALNDVGYTGETVYINSEDYSSEYFDVTGETSGIEVGTYTAVFTPTKNYCWQNGSTSSKNITWKIVRQPVKIPSQNGSLVYNGEEQFPVWNNFNEKQLSISGQTSGINAGEYTAVFTPNSGYNWDDLSVTPVSVKWNIQRKPIKIPVQDGELIYSGEGQSPVWGGYYIE